MTRLLSQPQPQTSFALCIPFIALGAAALVPACGSDWTGADDVESTQKPIVGGADTDISAVPWQVVLTVNGSPFCGGGSILAPDWVLTAPHCLLCAQYLDQASCAADPSCVWSANTGTCHLPAGMQGIHAGISRLSQIQAGQGQSRTVSEFYRPNLQGVARTGDIALLHLSAPLDLSGPNARAIAPATLADGPYLTPGTLALVSGWGFKTPDQSGPPPDQLASVEVPLVQREVAEATFGPLNADDLVAGYMGVGGKDACGGDSGGPLAAKSPRGPILAGVVSWGVAGVLCATSDYPTVYMNVPLWAGWIAQTMGRPMNMQWIADFNHDGRTDLRKTYGLAADRPLPKDYNGDGIDDLAVLRDNAGQWQWIVDTNRDGVADLRKNYGLVTDWPAPGDYDGDGKADLAVLRVSGSQWQWIIDTNRDGTVDLRKNYGKSSDVPVFADYDGDGKTDFAVLRVSGDKWQWIIDTNRDGTTDLRKDYGLATDRPIPADYDGDGKADFGVLHAKGAYWQWLIDTNRDGVADITVTWGMTIHPPVPADYDGDGKTDFAFVRVDGSQWQWFVDTDRNGGTNLQKTYGNVTDLPMPADFNGDGAADFAVIRSVQ